MNVGATWGADDPVLGPGAPAARTLDPDPIRARATTTSEKALGTGLLVKVFKAGDIS